MATYTNSANCGRRCPQPLPRILSTEEIVPTMERIISQYEAARNSVLNNVTVETASFASVLQPIVDVEQETNGEIGVIWMLQYGAPEIATQEAVHKARQLFVAAEGCWNSDDSMYKLLVAARDNSDKDANPDVASKLLLDHTLLRYKLAGCGAKANRNNETQESFSKESLDLSNALSTTLSNIAQENDGMWFAVEELEDLPSDELSRIKQKRQLEIVPHEQGKEMIFVPFSNGGTIAVLTFSGNQQVRKRMYLADQRKLQKNIPILQDIVVKRQRLAKRLGYESHAHMRMEDRLLAGPEQVHELLESLTDGLIRRGREELDVIQRARLKDMRQRQNVSSNGHSVAKSAFPPWDLKYYQNIVNIDRNIDQSKIAEYFSMEYAIPAMLQIFNTTLGLQFDPIPDDQMQRNEKWDDSVTAFAVWDTRSSSDEATFVGYLYFDVLWRPNKFRGAHNVTMEYGFERSNGDRKYPSTIVMSAFPTASGDSRLVLLKHHQLLTVFHELGHAIHSLVSRTKYSRFHGTSLPPDFVEIPSLMLENWCWMPEVLKSMSTHYSYLCPEYLAKWKAENPGKEQPPKEIPDAIVDALVKYRYASRGLYHLYQLSISLFDMAIHSPSSAVEATAVNVQKLWYDIRERIEGLDFTEVRDIGSELVAFNHLLGGFDVAYYSYLCCSSFAQDLFQNLFVEEPMNPEAWDRYRRIILQPGGEHLALYKLVEEALGHSPDLTALIKPLRNAVL
ncbi:hypothetical protein VHEMI09144 [[Torrubiella] hemipterigena]|uniref:Peptidase M3A/M3B catalytic domain-containing protein n=1 Tax=[Torrubiella] hemipterigena TaxID=1531966 RepID=A0A0A1TFK7_9HYPO|nr:hypothetical protein VHEMI09144 [[Torrubiella] hemipterigena]